MKDIIEIAECTVPEVSPEDDEITRPANEIWPGWIPVLQDAGQKAAGARSWIRPVPRIEPVEDLTLRDRFAMAALGAMQFGLSTAVVPDALAKFCYSISDAMLAERAKASDDAEAA